MLPYLPPPLPPEPWKDKQNSSTPVYTQKVNCGPVEFQHSSGWTLAHAFILGVFGEHKHLQTSRCSKQTEESSHIRVHRGFLDSSSKVVFGCRPAVPRAAALHSICLFLPHKGPFLQLPRGPGLFSLLFDQMRICEVKHSGFARCMAVLASSPADLKPDESSTTPVSRLKIRHYHA